MVRGGKAASRPRAREADRFQAGPATFHHARAAIGQAQVPLRGRARVPAKVQDPDRAEEIATSLPGQVLGFHLAKAVTETDRRERAPRRAPMRHSVKVQALPHAAAEQCRHHRLPGEEFQVVAVPLRDNRRNAVVAT